MVSAKSSKKADLPDKAMSMIGTSCDQVSAHTCWKGAASAAGCLSPISAA